MFITKKKHFQELKELRKEISSLKSIIDNYKKQIQELETQLSNEIEVAYNYNFPQYPTTIIVSKYVAEKFLKNKATFVSGKYQYKGLDIRVDESLNQYQVFFEAEWKEPPIICLCCGKKKDYEFAYPKDNPRFCDKYCFEKYINK